MKLVLFALGVFLVSGSISVCFPYEESDAIELIRNHYPLQGVRSTVEQINKLYVRTMFSSGYIHETSCHRLSEEEFIVTFRCRDVAVDSYMQKMCHSDIRSLLEEIHNLQHCEFKWLVNCRTRKIAAYDPLSEDSLNLVQSMDTH